jgi:hypothetical protein
MTAGGQSARDGRSWTPRRRGETLAPGGTDGGDSKPPATHGETSGCARNDRLQVKRSGDENGVPGYRSNGRRRPTISGLRQCGVTCSGCFVMVMERTYLIGQGGGLADEPCGVPRCGRDGQSGRMSVLRFFSLRGAWPGCGMVRDMQCICSKRVWVLGAPNTRVQTKCGGAEPQYPAQIHE